MQAQATAHTILLSPAVGRASCLDGPAMKCSPSTLLILLLSKSGGTPDVRALPNSACDSSAQLANLASRVALTAFIPRTAGGALHHKCPSKRKFSTPLPLLPCSPHELHPQNIQPIPPFIHRDNRENKPYNSVERFGGGGTAYLVELSGLFQTDQACC